MAAWETRMGTMQRTGYVQGQLRPPLALRWTAGICGSAYLWNSPTVSEDGIVYMSLRTEESRRVACLHALRLDNGSVLWHQPAIRVDSTGAATIRGSVLFAPDMYGIYCLDRFSGAVRWHYPVPSLIRESAPAVAGDLVHVGCTDGRLYTLDAATGQLIWQYATENSITSTPSLGSEMVYVGLTHKKQPEALVALAADSGKLQWKHEFERGISFGYNSTFPIQDGLVFAALQRYGLCAFAASSGQLVWRYELDFGPWTSPCVANNVVYVAGWGLHAVDGLHGQAVWSTKRYHLHNSAPIVTDEYIFIGGGQRRRIYAFDRHGGQIAWQFETGDLVFSTPALADNTLLIGCHDGYLYCFEQQPSSS